MVTVTATQELEAGDELRRFKVEVSQDDIHGIIRSIGTRTVLGNACYIWNSSYLHAVIFFFFFVGSRVLFSFWRLIFCTR